MKKRKEPTGTAYAGEAQIDITLKGNRWRLLAAMLTPRVKILRLRQHSCAIFIEPPGIPDET
jgi:hypothetical protein